MSENNNAIETNKEPETPVSHTVVGVRFRHCGKIYTFEIGDIDAPPGTQVVVESEMGLSLGFIARSKYIVAKTREPLKKVLRIATEKDFETIRKNKSLEDEAKVFCIEKAREYKLDMKVVTTETTLDKKRLIFYFTADGRIDFRELVRDLASKFKTRIEMRQIGVRDEVKMLGGIGMCGRQTCCNLFLTSFAPITIRMAKQQELSINQSKLSGICGRLMCCLGYEYRENGEKVKAGKVDEIVISEEPEQSSIEPDKPELVETVEAPQPDESLLRSAPEQDKEKTEAVPGQEKPAPEGKPGRRRRRRRRFRPDKGHHKKTPEGQQKQEGPAPEKPAQKKPETEGKPRDKSLNETQQPSAKKGKGKPFSKRKRFWKKKKE